MRNFGEFVALEAKDNIGSRSKVNAKDDPWTDQKNAQHQKQLEF